MTSQESGFSENIRTAIGLLKWSRYIFFVSMLKSILIIVKIISIPLQVDRALKSRKMCNFENLFLHCLSQRHCIVNIFPTLLIALLIFLFLEHCKSAINKRKLTILSTDMFIMEFLEPHLKCADILMTALFSWLIDQAWSDAIFL